MIQNTRISLKSFTRLKKRISTKKKFQKNIAKKTYGTSNLNLITKEKELFSLAISRKSKVF